MYSILDNKGNNIDEKIISSNNLKDEKKHSVISFIETISLDSSEFLNGVFDLSLPCSLKEKKDLSTEKDFTLIINDSGTNMPAIFLSNTNINKSLEKNLPQLVSQVSEILIFNSWSQRTWSNESESFFQRLFEEKIKDEKSLEKSDLAIFFNIQDCEENKTEQEKTAAYVRAKIESIYKKTIKKKSNGSKFSYSIEINQLPHSRHQKSGFDTQCKFIFSQIQKQLSKTKNSKEFSIPKLLDTIDREYEKKKNFPEFEQIKIDTDKTSNDIAIIDNAFSNALRQSAKYMSELTRLVDVNNKIPGFGSKSNEIMQDTFELFDKMVSNIEKDDFVTHKKQELEAIIDTSLSSIFLKQLSIIRELAIAHFKAATGNEDVPVDFAFFTADSFFVREAEDSVRPGSSWSYSAERTNVHNTIREISNRRKQLISEKIQHAEHQANAFQYLQMQQAQMQAIQQQQYGGGAGSWNIGAAYRPPDSNLNISMGYQQGRTNIQISMVPDEQASLLGPNGFTAGVGPANMGVSLNLNL
jgi:hypothetical protein